MFKILRYIILISLISLGYYLFILEFFKLSKKIYLDKEIVKEEIIENKEESVQENKKGTSLPIIKKQIDKTKHVERKIEILKGDTFVSILENLNFKQKYIYEIISKIESSFN